MGFGQSNHSNRLLIGSLTAILTLLGLFSTQYPPFRPLFVLIVSALSAAAAWEWCLMLKRNNHSPWQLGALLGSASVTASLYFAIPLAPLLFFWLLLCFLYFTRYPRTPLTSLPLTLFPLLYVGIPLATLAAFALFPDGTFWLFYLICVTKISDTCAYFVGRKWGKQPLAPTLSPKKTVEGATAGALGSALISLCFLPSQPFFALLLGILLALVGQLGDLAESLLKRSAQVKDSNNLPGLGGVLDILDSLLFTAPLLYLILTFGGIQ